jgi:hypothetical protein
LEQLGNSKQTGTNRTKRCLKKKNNFKFSNDICYLGKEV